MLVLQILFTVLAALLIAAVVPVGAFLGWSVAILCALGALLFFALMLLCKQTLTLRNQTKEEQDENGFSQSATENKNTKAK